MLLIDAVAFVSFLFLIATGLLIRYVLPAGSGQIERYGAGWRAAARPVSLLSMKNEAGAALSYEGKIHA